MSFLSLSNECSNVWILFRPKLKDLFYVFLSSLHYCELFHKPIMAVASDKKCPPPNGARGGAGKSSPRNWDSTRYVISSLINVITLTTSNNQHYNSDTSDNCRTDGTELLIITQKKANPRLTRPSQFGSAFVSSKKVSPELGHS